jgi:hypothetical protein
MRIPSTSCCPQPEPRWPSRTFTRCEGASSRNDAIYAYRARSTGGSRFTAAAVGAAGPLSSPTGVSVGRPSARRTGGSRSSALTRHFLPPVAVAELYRCLTSSLSIVM